MTAQSVLQRVGDALAAAVTPCYHYWRPKMDPPYLVWTEDGDRVLRADAAAAEQGFTGRADYYTRTEFDRNIDAIQGALDGLGAWRKLILVDYEEETGLIHYSWDWELAGAAEEES